MRRTSLMVVAITMLAFTSSIGSLSLAKDSSQAGKSKGSTTRPSIVAKRSQPPIRNFYIIYYDDSYLFAARHFGNSRDQSGNTHPGLFVHSKELARWIQVLQISTAGGKFGTSKSDDPEVQKKMRFASVGWDFTRAGDEAYIEQPLRTSGSIAFPDQISHDPATDQYKLRYFTSWGVPSVETTLYIRGKDLKNAFGKYR